MNTPSFDDFKHITLVHDFGLASGQQQEQKEFNEEDEYISKEQREENQRLRALEREKEDAEAAKNKDERFGVLSNNPFALK